MPASLKAPCRSCHLPYLNGKDGLCLACLRGSSPVGLHCACGEIAVTVLLDRVGLNGEYAVEIPLCEQCLALELESWECQSVRSFAIEEERRAEKLASHF